MNKCTWKELKNKIEAAGVKNETIIQDVILNYVEKTDEIWVSAYRDGSVNIGN